MTPTPSPPDLAPNSPVGVIGSDPLFSALRGKRFGCILADPPWNYEAKTPPVPELRPCQIRGATPAHVSHYYDTMSVQEICEMPVRDISEKDAVLFLWATVPLLPEALRVMDLWQDFNNECAGMCGA